MAGSGDQVEGEDVDAVLSAASASSVDDRRRLSAPEMMDCSGQNDPHENAKKKLRVHGASESLAEGGLAVKGRNWPCRSGNNAAGDDDTIAYIEKYNKYQAEYVCRLKAKYFSKKTLNGGNVFEQETNIDGENIKSSRWPCTRSFAEPVPCFQESSTLPSAATETSAFPGRKHHLKKSS